VGPASKADFNYATLLGHRQRTDYDRKQVDFEFVKRHYMNFHIQDLINEIKNINGATQIPINETQSFNPPNIKFPRFNNVKNIKINKIWAGASSNDDNYTNNDGVVKTLENITPKIFDKERIDSILSDCNDFDSHIWGDPQDYGTEVIAWYKSFHNSKYWGIYISYSSFLHFAATYNRILNNSELSINLAWGAIMTHESIHYGVDVACSKLEVIIDRGIYNVSKYKLKQQAGYSVNEEMIAEGALLRFLKSNKNLINSEGDFGFDPFMNSIFNYLKYLPPGYRDAQNAMTSNDYKVHADQYFRDLLSLAGLPSQKLSVISDLSNLMPLISNRSRFNPGFVDWSQCPIYIVDDSKVSNFPSDVFHFIHSVCDIEESTKFKKLIYPKYISEWKKTLTLLSNPAYPKNSSNLDFKRWPDEDKANENIEAWSVRVGGKSTNLRAHLDHKLESNQWVADRFGNADKMGHHKNKR